jgi:hypothetical protein
MNTFGFSAKGSLLIKDISISSTSSGFNPNEKTINGAVVAQVSSQELVRRDRHTKPDKTPIQSFDVGVTCSRYVSIYSEGQAKNINVVLQTNKNYERLAGKNILKDIKNFICPIAGNQEASLVRKRLIALQSIYANISNQTYNFDIRET